MPLTRHSNLGILIAVLFGAFVTTLLHQPFFLRADVASFLSSAQAEAGATIQPNKTVIFFCMKQENDSGALPLMNDVLKNTSARISITEFSGDGLNTKTRMYESLGSTKTLTEFQRNRLYAIYTDTALFFRCSEGLSEVAHAAAGAASSSAQSSAARSSSSVTFFRMRVIPDVPTDGETSSAEAGTPSITPLCPNLVCAQPDVPVGCNFIQGFDANGCAECGRVVCPTENQQSSAATSEPIFGTVEPSPQAFGSSAGIMSCPTLQCAETVVPEGCLLVTLGNNAGNTCPTCPTVICGASKSSAAASSCGYVCSGDVCRSTCATSSQASAVCGNNRLEVGEECDDGNQQNVDACDNTCHINLAPTPVCGNAKKEAGEDCDDGNKSDFDLCTSSCASVPQTQPGKLVLSVVPLASFDAFSGQKDVNAMRFTAKAVGGDADVNAFTFEAFLDASSIKAGFTLWRDADGDGSVDASVGSLTAMGSKYSIALDDDMGHIAAGTTTTYEVHVDIEPNVTFLTSFRVKFSVLAGNPLDLTSYPTVAATMNDTSLRGIKMNSVCTTFCGIELNAPEANYPTVRVYRSGTLFVRQDTGRYPPSQQLKPEQTGASALNLLLEARVEDMSLEQIQFDVPIGVGGVVKKLEIFDQITSEVLATATAETCVYDFYTELFSPKSVLCAELPHGALVIKAGQSRAVGVRPVIESLENGAIVNAKFAVALRLDTHTPISDAYNIYPLSVGQIDANGFTRCTHSLVCATGMSSNTQIKQVDHADQTTSYKQDATPSEVVITVAPATQQLWRHFSITGPTNTIVSGGTTPVTLTEANKTKDLSLGFGFTGMKDPTCLTPDCRKVLVPVSLYTKGVASFNYQIHVSANVDPIWTSATLRGRVCTKNTTAIHYDGLTIFDCPMVYIPGSDPTNYGLGLVLGTDAACPLPDASRNVILSFSPNTTDGLNYPNDRPSATLPAACKTTVSPIQ